jgi:hypothetical protein
VTTAVLHRVRPVVDARVLCPMNWTLESRV